MVRPLCQARWGAACALVLAACGPELGPRDATLGSHLRLEPYAPVQSPVTCIGTTSVHGIDVSKWQGTIDWSAVAGDGVDFAFIRVSDGLAYPDAKFAANWANARAQGILRGAYQFFRSDEDPIAQADYLIDTMGPLEPGDLPPVIDVESTDGQTPATIAQNVGLWIDRVESAVGLPPVIYTGRYFWNTNVASTAYASYPLWTAHWGASCPYIPTAWTDWTFWQHSNTGDVAGISGDVDLNVFVTSLSDLQALGAGDPVCGDGYCTGGETSADCPGDCPSCAPVPPQGRVIDDDDLCFTAGGPQQYIHDVVGEGYGAGLKWTKTWVTATPANYGLWELVFEQPGRFLVEIHSDTTWAQWTAARYEVMHAAGVDEVVIDQTTADGFVALGEFDFALGGDQHVRVDDAVSDAAEAGKQFVLDALRLTPVIDESDGGPAADGAPLDDGGPVGGDANPPGDTEIGDAETGDANASDSAPSPDGGPPGGDAAEGDADLTGDRDAPAGDAAIDHQISGGTADHDASSVPVGCRSTGAAPLPLVLLVLLAWRGRRARA